MTATQLKIVTKVKDARCGTGIAFDWLNALSRMKLNKTLWILVFICIINSMGFGIMIPLIYVYGKQFGATKETIGLLTAAFSIAQFFATPLLGALSDKFGRKPLLVFCLLGTCGSFILFGAAKSLLILFAARILDGLTGGDISVAQAMVSDISSPKERSRNFGLLGSAFGFGYVIGPAAGGLLSKFGMRVPFYFAAGLAMTGVLLSLLFLKETNARQQRKGKNKKEGFTYRSLIMVLKKPVIGPAVLTGFLLTTVQFAMLIGFQTFCTDALKLSPAQVGLFYAGFGITGILMQLAVPLISKVTRAKPVILLISTVFCLAAMLFLGFSGTMLPFAVGVAVYGLFNGLRNPMLNAIIAGHSKATEQGEIMGINQSYTSIGQTLGPVAAGLITLISIPSVFFLASGFILTALLVSFRLKKQEGTG